MIFEEIGNRAQVAAACDGLGTCYVHTGECAKALVLHGQSKVIAGELGDREALMRACRESYPASQRRVGV